MPEQKPSDCNNTDDHKEGKSHFMGHPLYE